MIIFSLSKQSHPFLLHKAKYNKFGASFRLFFAIRQTPFPLLFFDVKTHAKGLYAFNC
jgi:hypothetical protein